MNTRIFTTATLLLAVLCAPCARLCAQPNKSDSREPKRYMEQSVYLPQMPASLDFAGERVPLEFFDVRESMERELTLNGYWHSQTLLLIKLANRYFPTIEALLRAHSVPDDFKYLCVAESALQQVVSPAKAAGFWQLLPATARDYGLEVDGEVDERYHVERATVAACKYLKKAREVFGSWTMAAASYNMGTSGLRQQVLRQKAVSYYDLKLGEETTRYMFRILALKLILSAPRQYGYNLRDDELYKPFRYKEVVVSTPVESWADFAAQYGTGYKILKILNPWLREPFLTNRKGKKYYVKIPESGMRTKL